MKKLILLLTFATALCVSAQDRYHKGMSQAMALWGQGKVVEASNLFERISQVEVDNWIPYYYVALVNTTASFGEKDVEKLTLQLEKAMEFINVAKNISPENPELLVLQAMTNTAWIAHDGATYGPTLSGKNVQLYQKAAQIDPDNPRVVFSKAEWDMGSARYFGQDTTPYCKDVERALELFANFSNDKPFYPSWGQDRAEMVLKQCGE